MAPTPKTRQSSHAWMRPYEPVVPSSISGKHDHPPPAASSGPSISINSPSQMHLNAGSDDYVLVRTLDPFNQKRSRQERRQRLIVVTGWSIAALIVVIVLMRAGQGFLAKRRAVRIGGWQTSSGEGPEAESFQWTVGSPKRPTKGCNPFEQKGYLSFNETDPLQSRWRPYTDRHTAHSDCHTPVSLFAQLRDDLQRLLRLRSSLHRTRSHFSSTANLPRSPIRLPQPASPQDLALPWLYNRTVVLLGDSIDRFHLRDFCDLLSATVDPPFHPVSPGGSDPPPSVPGSPSRSWFIHNDDPTSPEVGKGRGEPGGDADRPEEGWPGTDEGRKEWEELWNTRWTKGVEAVLTRPWVCEVKEYGFLMVSVFTFGVEPELGGHSFSNFEWYYPPSAAKDRLRHILLPLLDRLASSLDRPQTTSPDLIEVASSLWDLRQFTEFDFRSAGAPLDEASDIPHVPLSDERVAWWIQRVEDLLAEVAGAFPEQVPMLWRTLHHPKRHYYAPFVRVEQLDQAARWLVERLKDEAGENGWANRLRIDEWGARMLGQETHFRDILHPSANPGGVLWSDMMLWELRHAVRGATLNEELD